MANSLYSDRYKELVCIRYFKGYKRGGLELNTNNSALYEFKGSFSYKIYLNLSISEKASLDVTICNRFSLGASIGAKHREKANNKRSIIPVKPARYSSHRVLFGVLSVIFITIIIIIIIGFLF